MSFASSHRVSTNGIVSLYYGETARKFEPCLCNEAHDKSGEWHDSSGVPLFNALGQEMEDVPTNVNLFMCEEIININYRLFFFLLLPPFTADDLNGDIYTQNYQARERHVQ